MISAIVADEEALAACEDVGFVVVQLRRMKGLITRCIPQGVRAVHDRDGAVPLVDEGTGGV